MKAAISTDGKAVSMHFGRCPSFTLVEFDAEGTIIGKEQIENPGHQPGFLPQFLSEKGVNYVIAGGAGGRAQGEKLAKGELEGGESFCQPGAGKGYGVEKSECDHPEEQDHTH